MRAVSRRRSGKAEEEPILVCTGDDDNAAGRRQGADPRRQRSAGHALDGTYRPACRALGDVAAMHASDGITAWRWWTLAELDTTAEAVWPARLAELIRGALRRR
jgi:hypothetical protein